MFWATLWLNDRRVKGYAWLSWQPTLVLGCLTRLTNMMFSIRLELWQSVFGDCNIAIYVQRAQCSSLVIKLLCIKFWNSKDIIKHNHIVESEFLIPCTRDFDKLISSTYFWLCRLSFPFRLGCHTCAFGKSGCSPFKHCFWMQNETIDWYWQWWCSWNYNKRFFEREGRI